MANPIGGNAAGNAVISGGSVNLYQSVLPTCFCIDDTNTYAYVGVTGRFGSTIAAGSNGQSLPQSSISVNSTGNHPSGGGYVQVTTGAGVQLVKYTGVSGGNTLTGCTGGTGVMSTGGAVNNAAGIAQVQLSNLAVTQYWAGINATTALYGIVYDAANSAILVLTASTAILSISFSGSPPVSGSVTTAAASITNFQATPGYMLYDSVNGVVYNPNASVKQLFGFYYKAMGQTDYTAVTHPYSGQAGGGNLFMASYGATQTTISGVQRVAFCYDSTYSSAFQCVARWRSDLDIIEILADGSGLTNSTGNGATPGTAIANPESMAYDAAGRLYVMTSTRALYVIGTDETTVTSIGTMSGGSAPKSHLGYMASGGFSGVGNGQLAYLDSTKLFVIY